MPMVRNESVTLDDGDRQVVFVFLPPGVRLDGPWGSTGNLVLPEEGHHEGLLGARTPAAHQADPGRGQRAV